MSLPMGGRCHTENIYGATIPHHFLRESKQHVQVGVLWTFPIFRFCFKFDGGWGKRNLKGDWGQREEGSIVEAKKKKCVCGPPVSTIALVYLLLSQMGHLHHEKKHNWSVSTKNPGCFLPRSLLLVNLPSLSCHITVISIIQNCFLALYNISPRDAVC